MSNFTRVSSVVSSVNTASDGRFQFGIELPIGTRLLSADISYAWKASVGAGIPPIAGEMSRVDTIVESSPNAWTGVRTVSFDGYSSVVSDVIVFRLEMLVVSEGEEDQTQQSGYNGRLIQ